MDEQTCEICGNTATTRCSSCGKHLCSEHVEHGIHFRTNAPSASCPDCNVKISRLSRRLSGILIGSFAVIAIIIFIVIYYFSTRIS